jgi:hypothetical protein
MSRRLAVVAGFELLSGLGSVLHRLHRAGAGQQLGERRHFLQRLIEARAGIVADVPVRQGVAQPRRESRRRHGSCRRVY